MKFIYMWRPVAENRPACLWRDHQWRTAYYAVLETAKAIPHKTVEVVKCLNCGRLRVKDNFRSLA